MLLYFKKRRQSRKQDVRGQGKGVAMGAVGISIQLITMWPAEGTKVQLLPEKFNSKQVVLKVGNRARSISVFIPCYTGLTSQKFPQMVRHVCERFRQEDFKFRLGYKMIPRWLDILSGCCF